MGVDDGVGTLARDVVDDGGELGEILRVEGGGHAALGDSLHEDGDAEGVHAFRYQCVDGGGVGECVVCVVDARKFALTELSTRLVDAKELEVLDSFRLFSDRCCNYHGGRQGGTEKLK